MKKLGVPVVTVITQGAFHRDPLYNMLQLRNIQVSAHVKCIASAQEVKEKTVAELDALLDESFSFDNFAWQRDYKVKIDVPFRADGLHRILYKCPHCSEENQMEGKGTILRCHACGKQWEMDEYGQMIALDGNTEYPHIPDWYRGNGNASAKSWKMAPTTWIPRWTFLYRSIWMGSAILAPAVSSATKTVSG